ncbi:MAG: hypothetical protein AAFW95_11040, partial [Cyanobacteria bacterium J06638_6]
MPAHPSTLERRDRMQDLATAQGEAQHHRQRIDGLLLYGKVFQTSPGSAFVALLEAVSQGEGTSSLRA